MDPKTEREQMLQDAASETPDENHDLDDATEPGNQLSEAENLGGDPDTPIAPDQATSGYPDSESGAADEGEAGPNARNGSQRDGATPFERGEVEDDGRGAGAGSHGGR